MRIAIFTEVFLPKIDGVVTRLTRSLEQLADMGHEVMVFTPGDPPSRYAGFTVVGAPGISFRPVYPEITVGFPAPRISRELRRFNPDVVHAVNPVWFAAYGAITARRFGYPLLSSFHTNVPDYTRSLRIGFLSYPAAAWIRAVHNLSSINLCTSGPMVEKAAQQGIRNVALWPKAVDTVGYSPGRSSDAMRSLLTDGHPEDPLVIYVGRMSAEKNLDRLEPIMSGVRQQVPRARLAMVGAGPQLEQLKTLLDPAGTTFTGYLSGADLADAFACGDVFVFPSTTETLGLVALESFASGVPVVGARAGGIPFVVDEGVTGYLVEPEDYLAWAERISGLLLDTNLRRHMGMAARTEAESHSWRAATEQLVRYYGQAIQARPHP